MVGSHFLSLLTSLQHLTQVFPHSFSKHSLHLALERQYFHFSACLIGCPSQSLCWICLLFITSNYEEWLSAFSLPLGYLMSFHGFKSRASLTPQLAIPQNCRLWNPGVYSSPLTYLIGIPNLIFLMKNSALHIPPPSPKRNMLFACAPLSANDTALNPVAYAKSLGGGHDLFLTSYLRL